jgi:hypothetical protein
MQRLLNFLNQAAVAQLVHVTDEHHQMPLSNPVFDDPQDEIWWCRWTCFSNRPRDWSVVLCL